MMPATQIVPVADSSQIGAAVRAATNRANRFGFGSDVVNDVTIVATQLASVLAQHALDGRLLIGALTERGNEGLELLALDRGSGMGDAAIRLCHRSVDGSPEDHGAIARFATSHEVYSSPGHGTALLARFRVHRKDTDQAPACFEVGGVSVPVAGESICGDGWCMESVDDRAVLMLVDGLGHGPAAHEAASAAVKTIRAHHHLAPGAIMGHVHDDLRSTRGAAVAVAEIDVAKRTLTYCGVGNIAGMVVTRHDTRGLVSQYGTAGQGHVRLQEFTYPFPANALLVLHSDGLKTSWSLDRFPGLTARHPGIVAAVLYGNFEIGRDDTTVIALRHIETPRQPSGSMT